MGKLLILCILFLSSQSSGAQEPDLSFHHITETNGLSYNIVNCFLKDSRGLLWIGTYNGLNRYDGAHFKIFRKDKQQNAIIDNTVHDLAEDHSGNIWGATEAGAFCYNSLTGLFKNYLTLPENEVQAMFNIIVDKHGVVWASNTSSVMKYVPEKDSFITMPLQSSSQQLFKRIFARKNGLETAPDGKGLWITTGGGLLYYDIGEQSIIAAKSGAVGELFSQNGVSALCQTQYGHYWHYDNVRQALVGFDPVTKQVKYTIQPEAFANLPGVTTVFEDRNHLLWISTWGYEIFTLDYLHGNTIRAVKHSKSDRSSIAGDFFWAAMHEDDGTLWLGTVGGISRLNTQRAFYKVHYFTNAQLEPNGASFDFVIENKMDSSWWLGATNHQLLHYQPKTGKWITYDMKQMPKNKMGFTPFKVNSLLFRGGDIYLFSNPGAWIKRGSKPFVPLSIVGIPDTVMLHQCVPASDSIWWMTNNEMLWRWNLNTNEVQSYAYPQGTQLNDRAPLADYLCLTSTGEPWLLAGNDYFSRPVGNALEPVKATTQKLTGGIGYYTGMTVDAADNFWVTKKGEGLYRFQPANGAYQLYRQYDGLVMDHIMDVSPDSDGRIWVAAYNRFSVYNTAQNSFTNFSIPVNENRYGYENYMTTLANGHVLSTVSDKVIEFFPDNLQPYNTHRKPVISAVIAAGKEKSLTTGKSLHLAADENDLQFQFGLLLDREESPFDMLYTLDGADKNWNIATASFDATYNKLAPGNYTFKIKAVAKDKSWESDETVIGLSLAAPFYRTAWFILLMLMLVSAGLYAFYRFRLQKHRQVLQLEGKAQLLEKEKAMAMFENLKQQLNPHFLFNSLTSLSGLIEADQEMAGDFLNQMSGIYRYILKHADTDKVSLREELEFVQQYIHLQQTRFDSGLIVNTNIPEEFIHYKIAPVTLQNLIENAIKHNIIDMASPLVIDIYVDHEYLVVANNLQKKKVVETSNKKGLDQFCSLYKFLTDRPVLIDESGDRFSVSIPLI